MTVERIGRTWALRGTIEYDSLISILLPPAVVLERVDRSCYIDIYVLGHTQFMYLHQKFALHVNKLILNNKKDEVVSVLVNLKDVPAPLDVLYKPQW